jgi:Mitochondrial carrier protein
MNYVGCKSIIFYMYMVSFSLFSMEAEKEKTSSFGKNIMIGSAAGGAEVLVNQPTILMKNLSQQRRVLQKGLVDTIRETPAQLYRGLGINLICMVPTTAAQIATSEKLKIIFPSEQLNASFLRNAMAGAFSALTCNPSELIIINQQNWKTNAWQANLNLYKQNGMGVYLRGYTAKAFRDGCFCAGFLTAYPELKKYFEQKTGSPISATVLSTLCIGPATAAASHPFDTVSTRMQADASKKQIHGLLHAIKTIYQEGGVKAFFAGLNSRTIRVLIAIPLMSAVKDALSKK